MRTDHTIGTQDQTVKVDVIRNVNIMRESGDCEITRGRESSQKEEGRQTTNNSSDHASICTKRAPCKQDIRDDTVNEVYSCYPITTIQYLMKKKITSLNS